MKKLLMLALVMGVIPSLYAGHLLVYKCSEKVTEYGGGDIDTEKVKSLVLLEVDDDGNVTDWTKYEYRTNDQGDKFYEQAAMDIDGQVNAITGEEKSSVLLYDQAEGEASSVSGKLKSSTIAEVGGEKVKEDVAKSLKGSGFEDDGNWYETWKTKYRLWSSATKAANGDEEGEANGDFDDAEDLLEDYLEEKGYNGGV
ncbi:MAG: hypothetical protein ACYTDT_13925 [Planctomycetota bacterium]|jgi:hypothetical protein